MSWRGVVTGTVLALLALAAWIQFSDRATSARIAPELDTPDADHGLAKTELQATAVVRGREPETSAADNPAMAPAAALPAVEAASPPDGVTRLHGCVYDESGAPLEHVSIGLRTNNGQFVDCNSNSDGAWVLETKELGERLVTAERAGYATSEQVIPLQPNSPTVQHEFVLRELQLVRIDLVLGDGTPALDVFPEPRLGQQDWSVMPVATKTDPGATYEWSDLPGSRIGSGTFSAYRFGVDIESGPATVGFLLLHEPAPLFISLIASNQVLDKRWIDAETTEVVFTISSTDFAHMEGRVTARVVAAEDGAPLACQVGLRAVPYLSSNDGTMIHDGRIEFDGVVPGSSFLVIRAAGRAVTVREVEVVPGRTVDLGEIPLQESVSIHGRISSTERLGSAIHLRRGRYDSVLKTIEWSYAVLAGLRADSFKFNGLEPGIWALRVVGLRRLNGSRPWMDPSFVSATILVDASLGSVDGVVLELNESTRVTLMTGKADRETSWMVRALDDRGIFADSARVGFDSSEADLRLPPGNFDLELSRDGAVVERRPIAVGSDGLRIDWPLR